jgi:hypothetical protein
MQHPGSVEVRCCNNGLDHASQRGRTRRSVLGAPRSMKMGATRSSFHFDAAARDALQSARLRLPTTLHYAAWVLPSISRVVWLPFDSGPPCQSRDRRDGPEPAIALWYLPLHARGLDEVIEGEKLAPINDLM